ncbi:MAG: NADH-quinone oxidoreductase subunit N, partial [Chloroflexi bacterium]|nr:NADH-quinone oxidoreductase subunit N [Chloroflexota bacterium]
MNVYLLSPELSLATLAMLLVLLDLVIKNKSWLPVLALVGLLAPIGFTISLLGRNETGFAGMLMVDDFSVYFKFLFLGMAALVILAASDYVSRFPRAQGEFYALILMATLGMMLLVSTLELISIFVALEMATVPL